MHCGSHFIFIRRTNIWLKKPISLRIPCPQLLACARFRAVSMASSRDG